MNIPIKIFYFFIFIFLITNCAAKKDEDNPKISVQMEIYNERPFLYNGISSNKDWPTGSNDYITPTTPPYLINKPEIIFIDIGRQLFVDDFLIDKTNLSRTCYPLTEYENNPVIAPKNTTNITNKTHYAMSFSDGIWYDSADSLFKAWYLCGYPELTCYATSRDGLTWKEPKLDIIPGTNIIQMRNRDASSIWHDTQDSNPKERYKMARSQRVPKIGLYIHTSPDGIHWGEAKSKTGPTSDRSTFFYNPFLKRWFFSLKSTDGSIRIRKLWVVKTLEQSKLWNNIDDPVPWLTKGWPKRRHVYNLDAIAYESVMLGFFTILSQYDDKVTNDVRPKKNELYVGFSRDGIHWLIPSSSPIMSPSSESNSWNWGNIQSVIGSPIVFDKKLYIYFSGRKKKEQIIDKQKLLIEEGSTGVGFLRRDGFCSMSAPAPISHATPSPNINESFLETSVIQFEGQYLFVNADIPENGELRVEVLTPEGVPIASYTKEDSLPIKGNQYHKMMTWKDSFNLSTFVGTPVKFKFYLNRGHLYSFWVSKDLSGASYGYVGGGGPAFKKDIDDIGITTKEENSALRMPKEESFIDKIKRFIGL